MFANYPINQQINKIDMEARERFVFFNGYKIYENGVILSKKTGKPLKYRLNDKGYPCVSLSIDGKNKFCKVHRIIALAFIPNPEDKPCVNHIDRDRENYDVSNLEWCTHSENVIHSVENGGRDGWTRNNTGINNGRSKLNWETVCAIRDLYDKCNYSQNKLQSIFNINQSRITKIINNKIWKYEK